VTIPILHNGDNTAFGLKTAVTILLSNHDFLQGVGVFGVMVGDEENIGHPH